MKRARVLSAVILAALTLILTPTPGTAQKSWLKDVVEDTVKSESRRQVDRAVRGAIRCAVGEYECAENARKQGKEVVYVDDNGEVITDDQGDPVMDEAKLPPQYRQEQAAAAPPPPPPAAVSSNYDFEAGDRVILYEDYSQDVVGDFPRNMELVRGNWDIVELEGQRMLRSSGPRHAAVKIPLPETLPEQFTIETTVLHYKSNSNLALATEPPAPGPEHSYRLFHTDFNYFDIGTWGAGVVSRDDADVTATQDVGRTMVVSSSPYGDASGPIPIRIMADGNHVKMYVGNTRVANVPNADLRRTSTLWLENTADNSTQAPIVIGPIRIAGGGRDLYDALATDGRVAVHDILFDTDQATIKPESAEVLQQIGTMLTEHPEMSLMIEGHTDSTGDFDHNMDLSKRRAEAVKQWLVTNHGISSERLRSMGLGSTQPKESNDTDEGKRQNRRVELVKI